jgi:glycosyltransferase involved in cell wall biosynthesis
MTPSIYVSLNFMYNAGSGGVTDVAENLCESLQKLEGVNVSIIRPSETIRNKWLRRFMRFFAELRVKSRLSSDAPSVVLYPNYFFSPFPRKGVKQVAIVHDLQFVTYPQYTATLKRVWLDQICKMMKSYADGVVFISQSTQTDFIKQYGAPKKHAVIYNPVVLAQKSTQSNSWQAHSPYAIANFHFYPHKNIRKVLSIFSTIRSWQPALNLLMTGKRPPTGTAEHSMLTSESVVHLGYLPKSEVYEVINGSEFFISMSEFEGFNMSAAESAKAGKPLILSDIPVHRELFTGWAFFVKLDGDDFSEQELKAYLEDFDRTRSWTSSASTDGQRIAQQYVDFLNSVALD